MEIHHQKYQNLDVFQKKRKLDKEKKQNLDINIHHHVSITYTQTQKRKFQRKKGTSIFDQSQRKK